MNDENVENIRQITKNLGNISSIDNNKCCVPLKMVTYVVDQ